MEFRRMGARTLVSRIGFAFFSAIFLMGAMLFFAYVWLGVKFTNVTIDVMIIHMLLHMGGADARYYYSAGLWIALVLLTCVLILVLVRRTYLCERVGPLRAGLVRRAFFLVSCLLLLGSIALIEARYSVGRLFFPQDPFSTYLDENYALPSRAEYTMPDTGGNNLVILLLESMETTFVDGKLFEPELMPRLRNYQDEGIAFTNRVECIGAESSIAAFYALATGMPNYAFLSARDMIDLFMGWATNKELGAEIINHEGDYRDLSIYGFLERHGYSVALFASADATFCEFDVFMATCTDACAIRDYSFYLAHSEEVTGKQSGWGLFDSFVYARAKDYLHEVGEAPFVIVIKTVGTHLPGNYEPYLPRPHGDMRDAYVQADIMAHDFIQWLRDQPFGERTTVAVIGDELLNSNRLGPVQLPPSGQRRITATLLNSRRVIPAGGEKRLFATFDLAPTLLEAVGGSLPQGRFGIGTSLFTDTPTLLERDGLAGYNQNIVKRSKLIESIY